MTESGSTRACDLSLAISRYNLAYVALAMVGILLSYTSALGLRRIDSDGPGRRALKPLARALCLYRMTAARA